MPNSASSDNITPAEHRRPLPPGSVIDFCGENGVVVYDDGGARLTVQVDDSVMPWYWTFEGESCTVISVPQTQNTETIESSDTLSLT